MEVSARGGAQLNIMEICDTLSPEQRDTNDSGRNAFKIQAAGCGTNNPTTAT